MGERIWLRQLGVALAAIVAVSFLPMGSAKAADTFDRGTADSCPTGLTDQFRDDESSAHEANINCVAHWDIAEGTSAANYSPALGTRRDQMASLVVRFMQTAGFQFASNPPDAFPDDGGNVHQANINRLAAAGIVGGNAGRYEPARLVTRDQMATFIAAALERVTGTHTLSNADYFGDDGGNPHQAAINELATLGIVQGIAAGRYGPRVVVRRDQVASFVAKGADFLAEGGRWPAFGSNQTFRIVPSDDTTVGASTSTTDNTGARTYTAFVGPIASVDIALIPCNEVTVASSTVTFGDDEGGANEADDLGDTSAVVETVNGSTVTATDHVDNATPVNQIVTFRVDSTTAATCVRPVVFRDQDNDNELDLASTDRPTESFGVGGRITWTAPEAAAGTFTVADVTAVDKSGNFFVGGSPVRAYYYDSNDTFRIGGSSASLDSFEVALSAFDQVAGTYDPDPGDRSIFTLTDSDPTAPSNVGVSVNGATSAVTVTWTASSTPNVDRYRVLRAPTSSTCSSEGTYNQVGDIAGTQTTFTDTSVPSGRHCYKIRAVDDGDVSPDSNEALADLVRPTISDVRARAGAGAVLNTGDFVQFTFSEAMSPTVDDGGATVRLRDNDGTVAELVCLPSSSPGANASCVQQPNNAIVRMRLVGDPNHISGGVGLSLPATVISFSNHWTDVTGLAVSVSGDVTVNEATITPAPETVEPTMTLGVADQSQDTVTVTYSEPVVCSDTSATRSQFGYTDGDDTDVAPTTVTCDGTATVILRFTDGVIQTADGATATLEYTDETPASVDGSDVRDLNGNQADATETQTASVQA